MFVQALTIIHKHNILFAYSDEKNADIAVVKYKFALRNLELQTDRSEPRNLNIFYVKNVSLFILIFLKGVLIDIVLGFEDTLKPIELKKIIEENKKVAWNTEVFLITKYFDDLVNKWKY